jgi:DNA-binding LacI/PurR family transcriptional regulator
VPEDVSVVGFDDIAMASWPAYRLTTIRQRTEVMTEEAIDLLARLGAVPDSGGISRLVTGVLMPRATTLPEEQERYHDA